MDDREEESLYEKLKAYGSADYAAFHMPGHKRRVREAAFLPADLPWDIDITEIDGFDNLHHAEGILRDSMDNAARCYGMNRCFYSVNGSTAGILAAVFSVTRPGDTILMGRNCHRSVLNAVLLRGLTPLYVYPQTAEEDLRIFGGYSSEKIEEWLITHPEIRAVLLTSPTYEGVVSDIGKIADLVHARGIPLIVDEAHGAHLALRGEDASGEAFPYSACAWGADLVIQSLHKTLPALTQTALCLVNADRVDPERVSFYMSVFQTSSPSYVLMASIDACVRWRFSPEGKEKRRRFGERLLALRGRLSALRRVHLADLPGAEPSKLVITADGMTGRELYEELKDTFKIQPEMCTASYVLLMTSPFDTDEMYERLCDSLSRIDAHLSEKEKASRSGETAPGPAPAGSGSGARERVYGEAPRQVFTPAQAALLAAEEVPLALSAGRVSAEYAYLYPPGIPLLVPGEEIRRETLSFLLGEQKAGIKIEGLAARDASVIRVIRADGPVRCASEGKG